MTMLCPFCFSILKKDVKKNIYKGHYWNKAEFKYLL